MNDCDPLNVVFLLFPQVTQLDLTAPAQVFSRLPNATVHLVAKSLEPVPTDSGFSISPTASFDQVGSASILCVPGGFGDQGAMEDEETLEWVSRVGSDAEWVTSVCTGALILGAAGLLKGYRATTHWASHHYLASFGATPVHERVVFDRNRVTGGGVTAGLDFALRLAEVVRGRELARVIQLSLEYDPEPPFACGSRRTTDDDLIQDYHRFASMLAPDRPARREASVRRFQERLQ